MISAVNPYSTRAAPVNIVERDDFGNVTLKENGSTNNTFSDSTSHAVSDPDLKPGFPVRTYQSAGTYHGGPSVHTLVGNFTGDKNLEIVVSGLANGHLYSISYNKHTGTTSRKKIDVSRGATYPAMGKLSAAFPKKLQVFTGYFSTYPNYLSAYVAPFKTLFGWPRTAANYIQTPPSLADVDGDGIDEIFIEEEDWQLHGYKADGTILSGWPVRSNGGQEMHTPAIADLDGDGQMEIISASDYMSSVGVHLYAWHRDGAIVSGFPKQIIGYVDTFPVIGDVDGDGTKEIVVVVPNGLMIEVKILSNNGAVKKTLTAEGRISYGSTVALADLDGDSSPEIILQTNSALNVWRGNGSIFPGWPKTYSGYWNGNSAPVVGDIDGDESPDIAITLQVAGSSVDGEVRVYNKNGVLNSHFPKFLKIESGAVPAIADIDRDGRNELIVTGNFWGGYSGYYDKVWAYDLKGSNYGPILWRQFGGNCKHQNSYPVKP